MNEPLKPEVAIFNGALEIAHTERAAYLDRVCAGDAPLRQKVESLLEANERAEDFLEIPPTGLPVARTVRIPITEKAGDKIGRYKLLQQIGEGGCGVVYMAEQEEPVRRRVALKVIKLGMDTKEVIARFEAERQALAMMDHPNIAKVLDAGATDAGRPYFVMELVRGIKITEFCDESKVSTEERLKLFVQVCQAIQHAHQKGIIHRDIKPSNILVTINDGVPVPKVIDFGIAKATQGRLTDATLFTAFEQFIGTPAYMSPEQAVMTSLDIDTRSDIYSLGVLLYELLTGQQPFNSNELLQSGLDAMRQMIREKEPLRPSTRLSTMAADALTTAAMQRQTQAPKLLHMVKGDLDWIVMTCLEKDRARRYETANGLAADIRRHMENEPVMARPPGAAYRFKKMAQRNKLAFSAATAIFVILVIGVAVSTWQAIRLRQAYRDIGRRMRMETELRQTAQANEKTAQTEAAKSKQVAQFLKDMLNGVGPSRALGRDTAMLREILDKTSERVGKDMTNQPEVEAELRSTIGGVYEQLAESDKAETMQRSALATRRKLFGNEHLAVANSLHDLAYVLWDRRDPKDMPEIEALHREALRIRIKLLGTNNSAIGDSLTGIADVFLVTGKAAEAEPMYREALAIHRRWLGDDDPWTVCSINNLADDLSAQKKLPAAEALYRQALAIGRRSLGNEAPLTLNSLQSLADVLQAEGKLAEAESANREALTKKTKVLGAGHPLTLGSMENLVALYDKTGRRDEALKLREEALTLRSKVLGPENPATLGTMNNLADSYDEAGRPEEALKLREETLTLRRKVLGPENPDTLGTMNNLADSYDKTGHREKAIELRVEMLALHPKVSSATLAARINVMNGLADSYCSLGRNKDAIALMEQACALDSKNPFEPFRLAIYQAWFGQDADYESSRRQLVQQAEGTDQPGTADKAAKVFFLRSSTNMVLLAKALNLARQAVELGKSNNDPLLPWYELGLGLAEYRNGRYAAAEQALLIAEQTAGYTHDIVGTARMFRAMSLFRQNKPEEARNVVRKAEAEMPPFPKDDHQPPTYDKPVNQDVLICWLAYKEAKALIEGPLAPK